MSVPSHLAIVDDPAGEQAALAVGAAVVDLSARDTVSVAGPDRLTWLTTLSSQILTDIGGDSREALFLDAAGHIAHAAGVIDTGERTVLVTAPGRGKALAAFLDAMRFMRRVEVADVSASYAQLGMAAAGPCRAAADALVESGAILALWEDPWPGVCPGGATYSAAEPHPGVGREMVLALVERTRADAVIEALLARARDACAYPIYTDDGHAIPAPRLAGEGAWQARRVQAWRPALDHEVDAKSLPHELDWLRTAVHLHKGCYCGQETVARIVNLGRPPRRLVFVDLDGSQGLMPPLGAAVHAGGRAVGALTSLARDWEDGLVGLALVKRAARAGDAAVTWCDSEGEHAVACRLTDIVNADGKSSESPTTRPGQGIRRMPGAGGAMRIGGLG